MNASDVQCALGRIFPNPKPEILKVVLACPGSILDCEQVEVSGSEDELLTVLAKFRDTLFSIPLPPPAAVDYEQALKDAQRESMQVR